MSSLKHSGPAFVIDLFAIANFQCGFQATPLHGKLPLLRRQSVMIVALRHTVVHAASLINASSLYAV